MFTLYNLYNKLKPLLRNRYIRCVSDTSQTCPNCNTHTGKKDLSMRLHECPECKYVRDRDVAASEVIKNRGLDKIKAVGAPV